MKNIDEISKQLLLLSIPIFLCCTKTPSNGTNIIQDPVDPPVESTIGLFLNTWAPKSFAAPSYTEIVPQGTPSVFITVDASKIVTKIPSSLFGQNSNIWMTQIVTEPTLMNNIKNLHSGVIRFPGGSLSDVFFWNSNPGQKPPDVPDSLLDANGLKNKTGYWYGKNTDSWTFSVDNYYKLLQQTGNDGMITINYGYARYGTSVDPVGNAAHLAADWVRYDNGRTNYWEIGNESNGTWEAGYRINTITNKDGQPEIVTGALYRQHLTRFIDSMKKAAQEINKTIYIGAYLIEKQTESWQTATDKSWNNGVLSGTSNQPDFYIIHSYYTPYQQNSAADVILNSASITTADMMNYLKQTITMSGQSLKPIAMTEWNINAEGSMQKVSYINGMHAAILLGEALKNKYGMTGRWDFANAWDNGNDHGLFDIGDEPGGYKWNPRPAFYYMYYFQKMIGDRLLDCTVSGDVLAYASSFTSGQKGVILVNKNKINQTAHITFNNTETGSRYYWYTLTGGTDNGDFSRRVFVNGEGPTETSGGPSNYAALKAYSSTRENGIKVPLPSRSVVYVVIDKPLN
jgi:hypothetical protein